MSDHFKVQTAQVTGLSQAIAGQQDVPSQQGDQATRSASGIDTGDLTLDSQAREAVNTYRQVLAEVTKRLTEAAQQLSLIAQEYDDTDQAVADRFDQIDGHGASGNDGNGGTGQSVPVASAPSISGTLAPEA